MNVAAGLRTRHMINVIRQSQFIALQTHVYIVPCHITALTWLDAYTAHRPFTHTCQSLIRRTLSATRIKPLLRILFFLLIAVNAGLIVPHCDLDACSITGYQESGPEYLERSLHGPGSPTHESIRNWVWHCWPVWRAQGKFSGFWNDHNTNI